MVLSISAQDTILGTYLPVVNTEIKQVWIHPNVQGSPSISSFPLPTDGLIQGNEYFWDYSSMPLSSDTVGNPSGNINTYSLKTYHPDSAMVQMEIGGHLSNFLTPGQDEAPQVSNWKSPIQGFTDVWTYSLVTDSGMYSIGHVNASNQPVLIDIEIHDLYGMDSKQLTLPSYIDINTHKFDSVVLVTELPIDPFYSTNSPITIKRSEFRELEIIGWGSMKTPIDSLGGVLLGRERVNIETKYYNNPAGTINDTLLGSSSESEFRYYFLRNNTFATSLLMQFNTDTLSTPTPKYAWYTLPVSVGSIEGIVYDTVNGTIPVEDGEVLLFREHGNFTRDDVLARADIDTDGSYKFEKIPYGLYRLAARATAINGNNYNTEQMFLSYYEDTTANNPSLGVDWRFCDLVKTTSVSTVGKNIYMRHDSVANATPNEFSGDIFRYEGLKEGGNDPIPGIDVIIKRRPVPKPIMSTTTNENGVYSFSNVPDGAYQLWVDVPGLGMQSSYDFDVVNGVFNRCEFDFDLGKEDIFREDYNTTANNDCYTGVSDFSKQIDLTQVNVYPNPFSESTVVRLELDKELMVSISVFDITGKLVVKLLENQLVSGVKEIEVTSIKKAGVYLIKSSIDNKTSTTRLIKL